MAEFNVWNEPQEEGAVVVNDAGERTIEQTVEPTQTQFAESSAAQPVSAFHEDLYADTDGSPIETRDDQQLSEPQQQAVAALTAGQSVEEVAEKLSLNQSTLETWQKDDNFESELALSIEEKLASVRQKGLALAGKAISCVEQAVKTDRCPKSALAVMRAIKAMHREVTESAVAPHVVSQPKPNLDALYAEVARVRNELIRAAYGAGNENGCESATLDPASAIQNKKGFESATFDSASAERDEDEFESATLWEEKEAPRVAINELPIHQRQAAHSLVAGDTIEQVACNSSTTVAEVRQWLRFDRLFQSALNYNFRDKVRHLNCRLLALAETSCDILAEAFDSGQTKIAIRYLRGLALM